MEGFLSVVTALLPYAVGFGVPLVTFRHHKKLKELELKDRQQERLFAIRKTVLVRSIDVMAESYHLVHKINVLVNIVPACSKDDDDDTKARKEAQRKDLYRELRDARLFWEKNLCYLPPHLRDQVIPLCNIAASSLQDGNIGAITSAHAFERISNMMKEIIRQMDILVAEYGIFGERSSENVLGKDK